MIILVNLFILILYLKKPEKLKVGLTAVILVCLFVNLISVISMKWHWGVLLMLISIPVSIFYARDFYKNKILTKKFVLSLLTVCILFSVYVEFFNGIETFHSPADYVTYRTGVSFFTPARVSEKVEGHYVYSIFQFKLNVSFFPAPKSVTEVYLHDGVVCYSSGSCHLGDLPEYRTKSFKGNKNYTTFA